MKIHSRLALLFLTLSLAACGSDQGETKVDSLTSGGAILSNPNTPTVANKATVGFNVVFPGVQKAAVNPVMNKVKIATSGTCGDFSLELSPTNKSGVLTLAPGACTFVATAYDASNNAIDAAMSKGTLLAGVNDVSLTFLGGPWLFVDPVTNALTSLTLTGNVVLTGFRFSSGPSVDQPSFRWAGPDNDSNGQTLTDLYPVGQPMTVAPTARVSGSFSGGTGIDKNMIRIAGGTSNLSDWQGNNINGQRAIKILGSWPGNPYPNTFNPTTFKDYYTSKAIDSTTIEGNIAEYTVNTALGTPYGSCTSASAASAQSAAVDKALSSAQRAATTAITDPVTVSWTQCTTAGLQQDVIQTLTNITIYPFRAKSVFENPDSSLQYEVNAAFYNYKSALSTGETVKGANLVALRKATNYFVSAANLVAADNLSNTADTARFFGAISRLASLGFDTASDGANDGLNDFNDLLDALGVPTDATSRSWGNTAFAIPEPCDVIPPYDCQLNLPVNGLTSGQILTLVDNKVSPQLTLAIAELDKISPSFNFTFTDNLGDVTNFDYGDALTLGAIAYGIKAELAIDKAYDLNLNLATTFNGTGPSSVQAFMAANPTIGTLDATRFATELTQAKSDLQTGLNRMENAITAIEDEGIDSVSQANEFITFYNTNSQCIPDPSVTFWPYCTWTEIDTTAEDIADLRSAIDTALLGINGPISLVDTMGTPTTTDDVTTIIDPSKFFAGISFRGLLPGFTGGVPNGLFPDPTMGGILVDTPFINVNADVDGNGKPDMLEEPNFYPALISGKTFGMDLWWSTPMSQAGFYSNEGVAINSDGTFSFNWGRNINIQTPPNSVYESGTATGNWLILTDGTLRLSFTSGAPANIANVIFSLGDYPSVEIGREGFDTRAMITFTDSSTVQTWCWWMVRQLP